MPTRGFPPSEFETRLSRAQRLMGARAIDALLLTTEPEVRYFSGFLTQFWLSPTRPWFLVVPLRGKPIAVIPEIGAKAMAETWIEDIRTWSSPAPQDEGVSLLARTLNEVAGNGGRFGVPMGPESHVRMPLADFEGVRKETEGFAFVDATPIIQELRGVKSEAEIEKIAHICEIVSCAFEELPEHIAAGDTELETFRAFKLEVLRMGADDVPYLVGGAGDGGYEDIISPPTNRPLQAGDVLMLDTGSVFDGYYCDFDRNYAIGSASDAVMRAYETLYRATEAGLQAARPGVKASEVFERMRRELDAYGVSGNGVGRMGHGLGMQLTEGLSLTPFDQTVLEVGMVITLEPGLHITPGKSMVHEEDIVIRGGGAELLTRRAPAELPVIAWESS